MRQVSQIIQDAHHPLSRYLYSVCIPPDVEVSSETARPYEAFWTGRHESKVLSVVRMVREVWPSFLLYRDRSGLVGYPEEILCRMSSRKLVAKDRNE